MSQLNEKRRQRYRTNPTARKLQNRASYERNRAKRKAARQAYYQSNRSAILERTKIRQALPEIKLKTNERQRNRRKSNPEVRLRQNVSNLINFYIKNPKSASCLKFLGYSIEELVIHLENLFEPWMNWENWGTYDARHWDDNDQSTWTWQIDHIIAQSRLPFSSMEDENFKICWGLKNLRPYSAKQNILDGNRK